MFFRFDGELIFPYMTPAMLDMEDGDIIGYRGATKDLHSKWTPVMSAKGGGAQPLSVKKSFLVIKYKNMQRNLQTFFS